MENNVFHRNRIRSQCQTLMILTHFFTIVCVCVFVKLLSFHCNFCVSVARSSAFFFSILAPSVTCTCNSRFNLFHPIGFGASEPARFVCLLSLSRSSLCAFFSCRFFVLVVLSLANDRTTQQILRFKCNVFLLHARCLATYTLKLKLLCSLTPALCEYMCVCLHFSHSFASSAASSSSSFLLLGLNSIIHCVHLTICICVKNVDFLLFLWVVPRVANSTTHRIASMFYTSLISDEM